MQVVGIDEAGRGPLAGPVAVGVVVVPPALDLEVFFPGLHDSKKLSEKKREEIFIAAQEAMRAGEIHGLVVLASNKKIDSRGIVSTIGEAIEQGLRKVAPETEQYHVFLDGSLKAPKEYSQEVVIGGDGKIPSIMLASILAKVTRDRYMRKIAEQYPLYGFEEHKGYGTKNHMEALRTYGLCDIHRTTFIHLDRESREE